MYDGMTEGMLCYYELPRTHLGDDLCNYGCANNGGESAYQNKAQYLPGFRKKVGKTFFCEHFLVQGP